VIKTTLEFPEKTLRQAKAKAAEEGIPLRQFITEAVEARLRNKSETEKPWMKMFGGLSHLHEENVRIQKIIDDEFEKIDPEDWD
jgi:enolase